MKTDFHFGFYSRLFVLAIIGLGFFALLQKVPSEAEITGIPQPFKFSGWAWSPNMGWLSMNCENDFDGDGDLDNTCISGGGLADYGLSLNVAGGESERAIKGCAWAGNIQWYICFSDPCVDAGQPACTLSPTNGIYLNNYYGGGVNPDFTSLPAPNTAINSVCHSGDSECHPSILFFEDPGDVWTHEFGFPIGNNIVGSGEVSGCFNCTTTETKHCFGGDNNGADCFADPSICLPGGGTCEVIDVDYNCDNCLQYDYDQVTGQLQSVLGGYQCHDCNNFDDTITCRANAYESNANTCTCDYRYNTPGLMADYTLDNDGYGSMCGWAWHAYYQDPDYYGVGWLQFSPRITTSTQPYFAVEGGDIYAKGNIKSSYPPPFNKYNAYIIETSGNTIQNLFSYNTTTPSLLTNRPIISFPGATASGRYRNELGNIDYLGLITEIGTTGKNKYGMVINPPSNWQTAFDANGLVQMDLDNEVYYDDSVWVNSVRADAVEINNNGGNGVIVLDGDVLINRNFIYNNNSVSNIKDIASLVWIIKGDVWVGDSVTELAGTFIVLGRDGFTCPDQFCGKFKSGNGSQPLTIYGSVLAKQFELNRPVGVGGEPSEKFINDGRLRINPPIGLTDFAKNLPIFNQNN